MSQQKLHIPPRSGGFHQQPHPACANESASPAQAFRVGVTKCAANQNRCAVPGDRSSDASSALRPPYSSTCRLSHRMTQLAAARPRARPSRSKTCRALREAPVHRDGRAAQLQKSLPDLRPPRTSLSVFQKPQPPSWPVRSSQARLQSGIPKFVQTSFAPLRQRAWRIPATGPAKCPCRQRHANSSNRPAPYSASARQDASPASPNRESPGLGCPRQKELQRPILSPARISVRPANPQRVSQTVLRRAPATELRQPPRP